MNRNVFQYLRLSSHFKTQKSAVLSVRKYNPLGGLNNNKNFNSNSSTLIFWIFDPLWFTITLHIYLSPEHILIENQYAESVAWDK